METRAEDEEPEWVILETLLPTQSIRHVCAGMRPNGSGVVLTATDEALQVHLQRSDGTLQPVVTYALDNPIASMCLVPVASHSRAPLAPARTTPTLPLGSGEVLVAIVTASEMLFLLHCSPDPPCPSLRVSWIDGETRDDRGEGGVEGPDDSLS